MITGVQYVLDKVSQFSEKDIEKIVNTGRSVEAGVMLRSTLHKVNGFDYSSAEKSIKYACEEILKKAHEGDWNLATAFRFIHTLEDILVALYAREWLGKYPGWNENVYRLILRPWVNVHGPIIHTNTIPRSRRA